MLFITPSKVPPAYRFDGIYFEIHGYVGPYPLNRDGDPRKTPPGRKFWRMMDKFSALPKSGQEKARAV